jgi:hypothetical protein
MGHFSPRFPEPTYLTQRGYSYDHVVGLTMTTPAFSVDLNAGDLFKAQMPAGDVTLTLLNPRVAAFRLVVKHNAATYAITFPTGYFSGLPGPLAYAYSLVGSPTRVTAFDCFYDGTDWYFTPIEMSV